MDGGREGPNRRGGDCAGDGFGIPSPNDCAGGSYTRTYAYDGLSRPSSVSVDYGSVGTYTSYESYDDTGTGETGTGRLKTVTAFSGFEYAYNYNQAGYMNQIVDAVSGAPYWTANSMDPSGRLTQENAGNGVTTYRSFWPNSGNIEQIDAEGPGAPPGGGGSTLANLSYAWDTIGNLLSRDDTVNGVAENFCYNDNADGSKNVLNRLSGYSVGGTDCANGSLVKTMGYDNDGNIAAKSDIGTYTYGQSGAGPHALSSIATDAGVLVDGVANPGFQYDADGNMKCVTSGTGCAGAARSYGWTSFDMIQSLTQGATSSTLGYDPEHNRGSLASANSGNTTWYFRNPAAGASSELLSGATTTWRDYLVAYGHIVAERFDTGGTASIYYFVNDDLGSTVALTDAGGVEKEYDSYDAWGKRRNTDGTDETGCLSFHPQSLTLRGFTGQEEMDSYCLVNLNARLYDPALGRFLSADSVVSRPLDGQNINRYSYVESGPLSAVDPSGYDLKYVCLDGGTKCQYVGGGGAGMEGWQGGAAFGADGFGGNGAGGGAGGAGQPYVGESDAAALLSAGTIGWSLADYAEAHTPTEGGYLYGYIPVPDSSVLDANISTPVVVTAYAYWVPSLLPDGWGSDTNGGWDGVTGTWHDGATGHWGDGGFRLPDYVQANVNIAVPNPWTGTLIGWSGSVSLDRYGDWYYSPLGAGIGKSATIFSGSLTANWMDQSAIPNQALLQNMLSANGFNAAAGFWGGISESYTPGAGWATGVGFFSPQAGASYNYSFYGGNIGGGW